MVPESVIEVHGFAVLSGVLTDGQIRTLISEIESLMQDNSTGHARAGGSASAAASVYAMRNLLAASPATASLARSAQVRSIVEPLLGPDCFAARSILFDKVPGANWKVVWHQDLSIAVREKIDLPGFTGWSVKDGVIHVQPPASVLERMLTVRLHLDDCYEGNGPVRVLPGSHALGRLAPAALAALRESTPETACVSPAGGALIMRPLILHASSPSLSPAHRRVIHLEYTAATALPGGLEWHTRV